MQKSVNLFRPKMQKSVNLFRPKMQKSVNLFCSAMWKSVAVSRPRTVPEGNNTMHREVHYL